MLSVVASLNFIQPIWQKYSNILNRLLLLTFCCSFSSFSTIAANPVPVQSLSSAQISAQIPPALQPWQSWVLAKHPQHPCPWLDGGNQQCLWVGQTVIDATPTGADFKVDLQLFQDGWVTLPGDVRHWPQQLSARNSQQTTEPAIRDHNGEPQIWLSAGSWQLSGRLRWNDTPAHLQLPVQSGLVQLQWQQQPVLWPKRLGQQLWLQPDSQQTADVAQDQLHIQVFRRLEDHIPARLTTVLQLDVSGNAREIALTGLVLPAFQAVALNSELPALFTANGQLRLQLQPGRFQVELISQSTEPPLHLKFPAAIAPWPESEILAFVAAPEFRTVQLSGAPAIDPNQSQAPADWRQYPLYQINAGSTVQLAEQSRGATQRQDQLQLQKMAWLDFNGEKLTLVDTLSGELASSSRLEVTAPYQLGRAELAGEPQLITQLPQRQPGVELRQNPLQLTTVSTMQLAATLPALLPTSGWQARFSSVELQLQLPPGWSLFTASGADDIDGSYVQRWTLWDIFFVLLLSTACGRLFGWKLALLSFCCMLLLYQRADAPQWLWLVLVSFLALLKIASGRALIWLQRASQLSAVLLLMLLLPFAIDQIRLAIYPQLEKPWHSIQYQDSFTANSQHQEARQQAEQAEQAYRAEQRKEAQRAERQAPAAMSDAAVAPAPASVAGAMSAVASSESLQLQQKLNAPLQSQSNPSFAQDPTARIQTGPARPDWQWQTVTLRWQGPVMAEEQTQLYLVPAWLNRIGSVLTVLLAFGFWWLLSKNLWQFKGLPQKTAPAALASLLPALLVLLTTFSPGPAFSQSLPSAELLAELEQRLLQQPACLPKCSSISALQLTANDDEVSVTLSLHSLENIAWQLPVAPNLLQKMQLDQQPATLFSQGEQHWLMLPKGRHQLQLTLNVSNLQQLNLQFAEPWHQLTSQLKGWELRVDTTNPDDPAALFESRRQLQLQRTGKAETQPRLDPLQSAIMPAVLLTRHLQLGLEWQLHSTLSRHGQSNAAVQLTLPLLKGETPISKLSVVDDQIQLQLAPDQHAVSWVSRLTKTEMLQLSAKQPAATEPAGTQQTLFTEVWQLAAAPQWHISSSGIPAIADATSPLPQLWQPWPGEQLQLTISQPPAITGETVTIHRARLQQQQGKRSADLELILDITASTAQTYRLELPESAEVTQLTADQRVLPPQASTVLQLPLRPGTQQVTVQWQQRTDSFWLHQTPKLDLGQAAGNIYLQLQLPHDRWLWAVTGPAIGPAVLFWGMLLVVLGLAVVLARVIESPLTKRHWLLLFAGISTVSLWIPLLIALWLFSLSQRGQLPQPLVGVKGRLQQLSLSLLSITTIGALLLAIPYGLLAQPDMHLTGNGSYLQSLNWYQDLVSGPLPVASAWSLPLWCYQLAMLLWSLWLATALVRWLPWAWRQLSAGGFWPAAAPVESNKPTSAKDEVVVQQEITGPAMAENELNNKK